MLVALHGCTAVKRQLGEFLVMVLYKLNKTISTLCRVLLCIKCKFKASS